MSTYRPACVMTWPADKAVCYGVPLHANQSLKSLGGEVWKPVPGFEGYYSASSLGRVRGEDREVVYADGRVYRYRSAILLQRVNSQTGYLQVGLSRAAKRDTWNVHSLILHTFKGPPAAGMMGCHNDGDPLNCKLFNLRWDTQSSNNFDSQKHGSAVTGPSHQWAKLTDSQLLDILTDGRRRAVIAAEYGVSPGYVWELQRGKSSRLNRLLRKDTKTAAHCLPSRADLYAAMDEMGEYAERNHALYIPILPAIQPEVIR